MNTVYKKITELLFEGVKHRKHRRTRHPVTPEDETTDHPFLKIANRLSATNPQMLARAISRLRQPSNPRRISAPSNQPAFSYSGKWKQHKIHSAEVEKKRAERSDSGSRKNVVAGLEDIVAQDYGQEGKKKAKAYAAGGDPDKVDDGEKDKEEPKKEKPKADEPEKVEVGGDFEKLERGGRTKTLDSRKNPSKSETFTQDIDPSDGLDKADNITNKIGQQAAQNSTRQNTTTAHGQTLHHKYSHDCARGSPKGSDHSDIFPLV